MIFLSHGPDKGILLSEHLSYVANKAKELADKSTFSSPDIAFYAGLFHDLGKLNPFYQEMFKGIPRTIAGKTYDAFHAPFSGWIAKNLLVSKTELTKQDKHRICMLVYGHHSKMKREPGGFGYSKEKGKTTVNMLLDNWKTFVSDVEKTSPFDSLNLDIKLDENFFKFKKSLDLKTHENKFEAFMQCGYFFSCLLQADRGSFSDFVIKEIDGSFCLNIKKLEKHGSLLGRYRKYFQEKVLEKTDTSQPIHVISAPTGAGKTKAFLSLINQYKPERVFYFSPLLALTDDISKKIHGIANNPDQILVYNHIFTGSLDHKVNSGYNPSWNFDYEAFNERFVITTTIRLLMTIYSNSYKDKMKLASFRDSLLIIDEVQTLPKSLLQNLLSMLKIMSSKMNTKTLLVSATIPDELKDLPNVKMDDDVLQDYLYEKNRKVIFKDTLEPENITANSLVMLNTRKKAMQSFEQISEHAKNVYYVSSGITQRHREKILTMTKEKSKPILVTTQVLESGVDISFTTIWRQLAPLDSIIQVLGRLDRESTDKDNAIAYIFDINGENNKPYSSLEYIVTKKMLQSITSTQTDTTSLYKILEKYYNEVHQRNKTQKQNEDIIDCYMENMDFEAVWKFVKVLSGADYYEHVYIPNESEWDVCKSDLLSESKTRHKIHETIKASLPISEKKLKAFWDKDLYEKDILLPKKEKLNEIYHKDLGLDKWITTS